MEPKAIDPIGCGCTECMTGEYLSLDMTREYQLAALLRGEIADNTDIRFTIIRTSEKEPGKEEVTTHLEVKGGGYVWRLETDRVI